MTESEPFKLTGKTSIVTGAARRIGASIAGVLHEAGSILAIHCRSSRSDADNLCKQLNAVRADTAKVFQGDLSNTVEAERLIESVFKWAGRLDVLINNASSFFPTPLGKITEDDWSDLMGSNLKAPLFLSQAAIPHLRSSNGTIVNIVDIHTKRPLRDHHVYGAAKAGLVMLTRSLAKDLAPEVRVNAVAPGAIEWPDTGMTDSVKENILNQIPLGRSGEPADIAKAALFLVRDATYSTGQVISIDGGRCIGW